MPYVRAVVTLTESAIENGINDDLNRKIIIFQGNEVWKEEPYSKSRVKVLTQVEHIPVHYADEKFEEGEEIKFFIQEKIPSCFPNNFPIKRNRVF